MDGLRNDQPQGQRSDGPSVKQLDELTKIFQLTIPLSTPADEKEEVVFEAAITALDKKQWTLLKNASQFFKGLRDLQNRSLFRVSVERGRLDWIKGMFANKIAKQLADEQFQSCLHVAAGKGFLHIVDFLWNGHIDIDALNNKNERKTPLHVAIESDQTKVVEALLKNHDFHTATCIQDSIALTPLALCVRFGRKKCFDLVQVQGGTYQVPTLGNLLHLAIQFGQFDMLKHLLYHHKTEPLINGKNPAGQTPLSLAASLGDIGSIALLYERDASLEEPDGKGRTAMHWAAQSGKEEAVKLLYSLGAELDPHDHTKKQKRPIDLVADNDSLRILIGNLRKQKNRLKYMPPNFLIDEPENLVFKGGGPKGVAYVGVVAYLEEKGLLSGIRRVAGTSAGAITACLLSMGYSGDEVRNLLKKKSLADFLDHPLAKKSVRDVIKDNATWKNLFSALKNIVKQPLTSMDVATNFLSNLYKTTGICEGKDFLDWIEGAIYKKTHIHNCTFGDLAGLIKKAKPFRHLYVFTTRGGINPASISLNSEDPEWKDLTIKSAIRASMSIPGAFKPHILIFRNSDGSLSERRDLGTYLDGGMVRNFPIKTFDKRSYITPGLPKEAGEGPAFNRRTLGFSLYSPGEKVPTSNTQIENIKDLLMSVIGIYMGAEGFRQDPYDRHRVVEIDNKGVGLLDFHLTDAQQDALIKSGRTSTALFFQKQHMKRSSSLFIRPVSQNFHVVKVPNPKPNHITRSSLMNKLKEALLSSSYRPTDPITIHTLYGIPGIGKTDLAHSFAKEHEKEFSVIYSLNCQTKETTRKGLIELAGILQLPVSDEAKFEEIQDSVYAKLQEMGHEKPYLLICDGIEKKMRLPSIGGCVLITTRDKKLSPVKELLEVPPFTQEEAIAFLKQATKQTDTENIKSLTTLLWHWPLSLYSAAEYIVSNKLTVKEYCDDPGRGIDEVKKIFSPILRQIQQEHKLAYLWLIHCSHFSNAAPGLWFTSWLKSRCDNPEAKGKEILLLLTERGLSAGSSIHPHLHTMVRTVLADSTHYLNQAIASALELEKGNPLDDPESFSTYSSITWWCDQRRSRVRDLLNHPSINYADKEYQALLHAFNIVDGVWEGIDCINLAPKLKIALRLLREKYGSQANLRSYRIINFMGVYAIPHSKDPTNEVLRYRIQALDMARTLFKNTKPLELVYAITRCAHLYIEINKVENAIPLLREASTAMSKLSGVPAIKAKIECLQLQAEIANKQQGSSAAIALFEQAIKQTQHLPNEEKTNIQMSCYKAMSTLCSAYHNLLPKAIEHGLRALSLAKELKDKEKKNEKIVFLMQAIGLIYLKSKEFVLAEKFFNDSLKIFTEIPRFFQALAYAYRGSARRGNKDYVGAYCDYETVVEIIDKNDGLMNSQVFLMTRWQCLFEYAECQMTSFDTDRKALGAIENIFTLAPSSLQKGSAFVDIYRDIRVTNRGDKICSALEKAIKMAPKLFQGKPNLSVAATYRMMATTLRKMDKNEQAIPHLKSALEIVDQLKSGPYLGRVGILTEIGLTYSRIRKKTQALEHLKKAVAEAKKLEQWDEVTRISKMMEEVLSQKDEVEDSECVIV